MLTITESRDGEIVALDNIAEISNNKVWIDALKITKNETKKTPP